MAATTAAGEGIAGSTYDGTKLSFPAVPYDQNDFNDASLCDGNQAPYNDIQQVTPIVLELMNEWTN